MHSDNSKSASLSWRVGGSEEAREREREKEKHNKNKSLHFMCIRSCDAASMRVHNCIPPTAPPLLLLGEKHEEEAEELTLLSQFRHPCVAVF